MKKKLCLIIKAGQEWFRHTEFEEKTNAPILNQFFESISNVYIPFLNILEKFESEENFFCFNLVLPPVLCALLSNEKLQDDYLLWLDKKNLLGQKELKRNQNDEQKIKIINAEIERNKQLKIQFAEKYQKKLIPVFKYFMQKGMIELLGTCGTDIFIPHYADLTEIISAQIEIGLYSYKKYFGTVPEGFWLPDLGYIPGVEQLIKAFGYSYTIVDSQSFLLAENVPQAGTFEPCRIGNFVFFANDYFLKDEFFGEKGIILNKVYRNQNCDIGFELEPENLAPLMQEGTLRFSTGFKYYNKNFDDKSVRVYNKYAAHRQVIKDAKKFVQNHNEKLQKACEYLNDKPFVADVCTFELERYSRNWYEFVDFIENVILTSKQTDLQLSGCACLCNSPFDFEKIIPYFSAQSGEGYGENFLSSKNCWMMRYIRKACERMIDLAERFPSDSGLKNRLLNLGAQELMLALSSNLADAMNNSDFMEFAERRFNESILAFTNVFDALGSNTVSTEWLTRVESKDSVFPWMNYKIFAKKR